MKIAKPTDKAYMWRHLVRAAMMVVVFCVTVPGAHAANSPLTGRVAAAIGNDIPNATVEVFNGGTQILAAGTTTDANGLYSVTVADGVYDVKVTPPIPTGLAAGTVNGVVVNGPTVQNITLAPALAVNLSGTVRDGNGNPIQYASVGLHSNTSTQTQTDANGDYSLLVTPGTFYFQVQCNIGNSSFTANKQNLAVNANTVLDIDIPSAVLSGLVLTPGNQPVSNVGVSGSMNAQANGLNWSAFANANSDANGNYSLTMLSGSASLNIFPPPNSGFTNSTLSGITINGNTNYDIILQTGVTLSGTVRDGNGNPIQYASVGLHSNTSTQTQTDANGDYSLLVTPGTFYFQVQCNIGNSSFTANKQNLAVNANTVLDIDIPSAVLSGLVLTPGNQPVSNVGVSGSMNAQANGLNWSAFANANSDANGNYSLTMLSGSASLNIFPPPNSGFTNSTLSGITINGNTNYDIILQTGVTLSGTVRDGNGNPIQYASVGLHSNTSTQTQTDANGDYSLLVTPGTFYFQVQCNIGNSSFTANKQNLIVNANTVLDVNVPTRTLSGTVVDINGQPVNGVSISVQGSNHQSGGLNWSAFANSTSAGNGNYSLTLLPGTVMLQVFPPPNTNFIQTQINNVLIGNDPNTLSIVLLTAQPPNPEADLMIEKTASSNTVAAGSTVTYTITVTNNGPDAAETVVVTDELSGDLTFDSCSSTHNGTCGGTGNSRTVSFAALLPNVTATITFVAQVNNGLLSGQAIGNTATVTSVTPDPVADNTSGVVVTVSNPGPDMTVPGAITVPCDLGVCSAAVNVGTPTINGNPNGIQVAGVRSDNLALTAPYPKGPTVITWTATNAEQQTATGTQTITVEDRELPVINCPQHITVAATSPAGATVSFAATATDNCDGQPDITYSRASGSTFAPGVTTVQVTATDDSGNAATCNFTVTVNAPPSTPPNTPGAKVTGGGGMTGSCGSADFNINAQVDKNGQIKGDIKFQDSACNEILRSTSITSLVVLNGEAWIAGQARTNDGNNVSFSIYVHDRGEPGSFDTYSIAVSDGYTAGSTITNGNIQVHKVK